MPLLRQNLGFLVEFADQLVVAVPLNPITVKLGSCPMPLLRQNLGFLVKFADRHVNVIPLNPSIVKLGSCPMPLLRQNLGSLMQKKLHQPWMVSLWPRARGSGDESMLPSVPKMKSCYRPWLKSPRAQATSWSRRYSTLARKKAFHHRAFSQGQSYPRLCQKQVAVTAWLTVTACRTSDSKPCTSKQMKVRRLE